MYAWGSSSEAVGQRACAPGASRWGAERECSNFLQHEIHKNSLISVEAGMGMEGQIMCIEHTFQMSSVAFLGPPTKIVGGCLS